MPWLSGAVLKKYPHVIQSPDLTDSIFVKVNVTLVNKNNHILQISVRELQNDLIFPFSRGGFYGARNEHGKVYIGDKFPIKYIPKHINQLAT